MPHLSWAQSPTPLPSPTSPPLITKDGLIEEAERIFYSYDVSDRMGKVSAILDQIAKLDPKEPYALWARARVAFFTKENYYVTTEKFSADELVKSKLALADQCHRYSDDCIKLKSNNAECHLLKGSCYAMQASTWGVGFKSLRVCRPMDVEWEKAMKLPSTFKHQGGVTSRQLAQILRGILYRVMPDTWWFRFLGGIRGDKSRSYAWMQEAISGPPLTTEPMIMMEKAATTMCYGQTEGKREIVSRGIKLLEEGLTLPTRYAMDDLDKKNMRFLLEHPSEACNYRRERFEDLSADAIGRSINAEKRQ